MTHDRTSGQPKRTSPRLAGFSYSEAGAYFVTICVQNMTSRFGSVRDGALFLNGAGVLISSIWEANASRYPGVELDAHIVMPNHLHGIVFVGVDPSPVAQESSLLRVVQSFKSLSTVEYIKGVRDGRFPPFDRYLWQRSFYDRILRSQRDIDAARAYIEENPWRWEARATEK